MSDTKLTVSLVLNDSSFTKQLLQVNKNIKLSETQLKNASKGNEEFGKSLVGTQSKLKALTTLLNDKSKKVELYKNEISKTSSTLGELTKKYEAQKTTLADLKTRYEETCNTLGKNSDEAKALKEEITKLEKSNSNLETRIVSTNSRLTTLETGLNEAEAEFKDLSKQVDETSNRLDNFKAIQFNEKLMSISSSLEGTSKKLGNVSKAFDTAYQKMRNISIPILGIGTAATAVSVDFESAMSNVAALSGATGDELKLLEAKAREMGAATSKSAKDSADALGFMSLAGWNTSQMLAGLEPILRLSEAGNMDLATASDLVTDSMSTLGLEVQYLNRYLDIVAKTQASANTSAQGMLDAYIGVGGTFRNLNVSLEEGAAWLGVLANRGIKSAEAGSSLNSVLVNVMGTSGQAKAALKELGVSAWDQQGNFKGIEQTLRELDKALGSCTEQQRNIFTAMIGGKTQMDTLNAMIAGLNGEYTELKGKITDSNGALMDMAEIMQDNVKGQLTRLKSALEEVGLKLGEVLLPMFSKLVEKISLAVDWFSNLSPSVQESIVKFGLATVALTGLTKGFSSLFKIGSNLVGFSSSVVKSFSGITSAVKGVAAPAGTAMGSVSKLVAAIGGINPITITASAALAGLAGAIYASKKSQDVLNESVLVTTDEMSGLERAIDKLNGGYSKSRAELEELGVVQKELSDTLSDDFKKAVEESESVLNDFNIFLRETSFDDVLTEEEANQLVTRVDTMCQSAINAIKSKQEETNKAMSEMFASDGVISESEAKVLEYLQRTSAANIEQAETLKKDIYEIKKGALENQRQLSDEEIKIIEEKTRQIKILELEALGTSQEERMFAEKEFAYRVNNMTLEEATKLLQEKAKLRDEEIVNVGASYDTYIEVLKQKMEQANGEEKVHYASAIADAEKARNEKINIQNDLYNEYLRIINEKNPEVAALIDKYNGDELTKAEVKSQNILSKLTSQYEGMNTITETGLYKMKRTNSDQWNDVVVTVDKATGEITGAVELHSSRIGAYNNEIGDSLKELQKEYKTNLSEAIKKCDDMGNATVDSKGQIVKANGEIIDSLKDVTENSDGTREGIIKLNGTEMKIKTNAQGVITDLKEIREKILNIPSSKVIDVSLNYKESNRSIAAGGGGNARSLSRSTYTPSLYSYSDRAIEPMPTMAISDELMSISDVSRNVEIPNRSSYINDTVNAIATVQNSRSTGMNDISKVMAETLQETQKQNNLLMNLISLMQENRNVDVQLAVDGRQIAKATAKYMQSELDTISLRKSRLGGSF